MSDVEGGAHFRIQPTLEKVAELAGVSRATVSRVINSSPRVSSSARSAVEDAIRELGYSPNRAARSLVTRRSDTIALVVPEPGSRVFSEPYFGGLLRGITATLADSDFQLVLSMPQGEDQIDRLQRYLANGHADGLLMTSFHGRDLLVERLNSMGIPLVLGGRPAPGLQVSYVDADNRGGAHAAVRHLVQRGRRRIATITGPQDMAVGVDRLAGYRSALSEAGIEEDPRLVVSGDFSRESGVQAMEELLGVDPDALFAASDLMAVGALELLHERGVRVPEGIAVIGFDDSDASRATRPPLSSVAQPVEEMGREMARILIDQITSGDSSLQRLILETELVARTSS